MKIGVISDLHYENHKILGGPLGAGVNRRCSDIGEAVRTATMEAAARGCHHVVVTGDIFDNPSPSPEVIGQAASDFSRSALKLFLMPGNHERSSDTKGHNALAALRESQQCLVDDRPMLDGRRGACDLWLPFVENPRDYIDRMLAETPDVNFIFLHAGIVSEDSEFWAKEGRNTISVEDCERWAKEYGVRGVIAGDWHGHRILKDRDPLIVQVGSLTQVDFGDPPNCGKLVVLDADAATVEVVDIPGPRLISLNMAELRAMAKGQWPVAYPNLASCSTYLRVSCTVEERNEAEGILESSITRELPGGMVETIRLTDWMIVDVVTAPEAQAILELHPEKKFVLDDVVRTWCAENATAIEVGERAAEMALRYLNSVGGAS
jgi:DNA repair exonuclease SbcCD nuclease subunit